MKNKSFSKKLLYILLMLMVLAISLTACGEKDRDDDEDRKSRKEKTVDDDEDEDDEEEEDEDSDEDEPEATPEPTAEPKKWRYAYSDFFEEYGPVLKENMSVRAESDFEGWNLTMNYAYNQNVKGMMVIIDDKLCELYGTLDDLYCQCEMDGEWVQVYTPVELDDIEDYGDMFWAELMLEQMNNISYKRYIKEVEEDGIFYDVVKGAATDNRSENKYNVECYINRETQEISKIDMIFENGDVLHCYFEYLTEKEINNTYKQITSTLTKNGKKVDIDELKEIYINFIEYITLVNRPDNEESNIVKEKNWDTYYADYFDEAVTFPDSYAIQYNLDLYGFAIEFKATVVNGETWIRYIFGDTAIDAYFNDLLILVGSPGLDVDWALAYLDSTDQVEDIFNMDFWSEIAGKDEKITYIDYVGSETINGAIYDVVEVKLADSTQGLAYINRENKRIYKFSLEMEGMAIQYLLEDYDPIKIPYEATEAKEMTVDEISNYFEKLLEAAMMEVYMY